MIPSATVRGSASIVVSLMLGLALATGGIAALDGDTETLSSSTIETTESTTTVPASTQNGSVNVSLAPVNASAAPGENITYDIVITGPDSGLSSYDVRVDLANDSVASIVDVQSARPSGFGTETVIDNGSAAELERALGDDTFAAADKITLGTITVSAETIGNTSLTVADDGDLTGLNNSAYAIEAAPASQLSVAKDVPEGTLAVEPATGSAVIDFTREYDIVLESAEDGVSSFEMSVALDSPENATIVDAETVGEDVLSNVTIDENGQTITITQAQLDDVVTPTDSVVLATLNIEMQAVGTVNVDIEEGTVSGVNETTYDLTRNSGSIEVIEPPEGPDATNNGQPATDTTGDGKTNDISGDGEFTIADVQELFKLVVSGEIESIEEANKYFDFTESENVSIADVQALFEQYNEQN